MHYRPVVDQIIQPQPLDPLAAILFVALFALVALLTSRRPAYGLCALVLVVPFAFYHDALGTTITLPKVALLGTIAGLTTYAGAFACLRERVALRFLIAGTAVVAMTALSIAQATVPHPAVRETLKAVEYLALFATAYTCYRIDPDTTLVQRVVAFAVGLVSALALLQEILGAPSALHFNGTVIPRVAGPLEGPNQLAGYLEVSIAILAACICSERSKPARREMGVALLLAVFADILTYSRAGLVASLIALVIVAILYGRAATALVRPLLAGALLGGTIAGAWAVIPHWLGIFRIPPSEMTSYAGGVGTRPQLWAAALQLWRQHPLLGVGAGNFELDLPQTGLYGIRTHANSLYLQALVEGGIPLLLATLYLLWTSIATFAGKAAVQASRAGATPLIAGALAASVALAFHQIFDYLVFYSKVGEWWWLILALGAAQLQSQEDSLPILYPRDLPAPVSQAGGV